MARSPSTCWAASVTIPAGLVKLISQAAGARPRSSRRARPSRGWSAGRSRCRPARSSPARARRAPTDGLVDHATLEPAGPDGAEHELGALDGVVEGGGGPEGQVLAGLGGLALEHGADALEPPLVEVVQHDLVEAQRRPSAAAARRRRVARGIRLRRRWSSFTARPAYDSPELTLAHVQPHDVPGRERAHLDQVAQLVGQPQPVTVGLALLRALAAGQRRRISPKSSTSHSSVPLSCQMLRTPRPPPWRTLLAAISLTASRKSCSRSPASAARSRGRRRSGAARSANRRRTPPGRGSRTGAGSGSRTAPRGPRAPDRRCWAARRRAGGSRTRARRPPGPAWSCRTGRAAKSRRVGEGDVQQALVAMAFGHLGGAARGPDRLADPATARAGMGVDELAPGGDDARRVRADIVHVGELDVLGVAPQRLF